MRTVILLLISFSAAACWRGQREIVAPAVSQPPLEKIGGNSGAPAPFGQRPCLSVHGNKPVVRFVVGLRQASSPFAVSGLVIPIVVDSVDRIFYRRPLAHVGEEVCKISPALTNGNPSTSVATKVFVSLVEAPLIHGCPDFVFGGPRPKFISGAIMRHVDGGTNDRLLASATFSVSTFKIATPDDDAHPAIANALPSELLPGHAANEMEDSQKQKLTASEINECVLHEAASLIGSCMAGNESCQQITWAEIPI